MRYLEVALELDAWLAERDDRGYDPHDLLASPLVRALTLGTRWGGVLWTQLGRRSPIQFRPLLGVPRSQNSKGIGLALSAQRFLYQATGRESHRERARVLTEWLDNAAVRDGRYPGIGWGYPFPWANRDFYAPAGTPASVVTVFNAHTLLDTIEQFGWTEYEDLVEGAVEFLRLGLNRLPGPGGSFIFSYTPLDRRWIHNASLLTASLLARAGAHFGDDEALTDALRAADFTRAAQRSDGSWPYGLGSRNSWVDSFHTGYKLIALDQIRRATGSREFDEAIERGLDYWKRAFFVGPAVGFFSGRPYPIDMHAVAHAILTLLHFRAEIPDASRRAEALADWALAEMRDREGYFYYQRHRHWTNRMVYMRWVQAWALRAFAELGAAEAEGWI